MKVGVVVFPGSNCEQDVVHAIKLLGGEAHYVWHGDASFKADALVLPGGFAYGDYLRTGAIAANSPIMDAVRDFASSGGPVLGICNGFQILCESGILPGALRRNAGLRFRCTDVYVKVETADSPFTSSASAGEVLSIPINHFEGNYYCSKETMLSLQGDDRVALRYCSPVGELDPRYNPNGALDAIAGVLSKERNVLGMMPHPERATDPAVGGTDGRVILASMLSSVLASR